MFRKKPQFIACLTRGRNQVMVEINEYIQIRNKFFRCVRDEENKDQAKMQEVSSKFIKTTIFREFI